MISEVDDAIINLNILSILEPNKKLNTKETYLNVESKNIIPEWIRRWRRGDDRDESIKKIDNIVAKSLELIDSNFILKSYLIKSIKGIENLKETYSQDIQSVARLDTIIEKIKIKIKSIDEQKKNF